ncbi:hypothetical protein GNZ12_42260 [Paraburkholderia sp. 1N]|uniref:Gp5/Type VI secretion system Vgr protein OB-fold domain-containing protein n=1 Tax=Paraburkholderia solitsugae TaxID=2675748 RepID=A0ABX2C4A5_9BURK|nr:phage baseplate assembly protein V [Paraburkholderia solitsugae]NPT47809.1 hypothetical protein [Paraburkholderia solitsugae]
MVGEEQNDKETSLPAGLPPGMAGLQIGIVRKIDADPLAMTRVLVDLPLIDHDGEGIWARVGSLYGASQGGISFMPEIGDEVLVGFINNDPRSPVVLGSVCGGKHGSPDTSHEANTSKTIVTRGQIRITLQDIDKTVTIETPGGQVMVMSDTDESISITDSHANNVKLSASGIALTSPKDIAITASGAVNIQGAAGVNVTSSTSVKAEAPQINAEASMTLALKGNASAKLSASGELDIQGSFVRIN